MQKKSQQFDARQQMQTSDFEIFHYRDSTLSPVPIHHHDFYEVYFFLNGQVEYRVEGTVYHMEPGDLLLISPMELHQPIVQPDSGLYERMVLWINRDYLRGMSTEEAALTLCFDYTRPGHTNLLRLPPVERTGISSRIYELQREAHGDGYGASLWAKAALMQLLVEFNRIALRSVESRDQVEPDLVSKILEYIGAHYDEPLSLDGLASQFYVSKYFFSHAFQQKVGISVYRYILLKRLLNARELLSNGNSPSVVCRRCGFGDYANFYRAFKSEYGVSPREYQSCSGRSLSD